MGVVTEKCAIGERACPEVTICVANYNGIDVLGPCLRSVFEQDCELSIEVILHDDASTDDSINFVRSNYPQVRIIESTENVGFCISNNRMVSKARGRHVLLLNNDAVLHRDAIRTLYAFATKLGRPAILGLPQYNIQTGELIDIGSLLDPFMNPVPNRDRNRRQVAMVIGACFWIPRTLWDELGGFPEWFGSLAEDMYLCCLARLRGYPVLALAESGFDHWVGRSFGGGKVTERGLQTTYRRRALSERNKLYVMVLCYPRPYSALLIPLHSVMLILEGALVAVLKRDRYLFWEIYLNSLRQVWSNRRRLFGSRRELQRNRASGSGFFCVFSPLPQKLAMLAKHGLPDLS
jgi:GT2 family glycosyltransferase